MLMTATFLSFHKPLALHKERKGYVLKRTLSPKNSHWFETYIYFILGSFLKKYTEASMPLSKRDTCPNFQSIPASRDCSRYPQDIKMTKATANYQSIATLSAFSQVFKNMIFMQLNPLSSNSGDLNQTFHCYMKGLSVGRSCELRI